MKADTFTVSIGDAPDQFGLVTHHGEWAPDMGQDRDVPLALSKGRDRYGFAFPLPIVPDQHFTQSEPGIGDDVAGGHDVLLLVVLDDERSTGIATDPDA